MFTRIIQAQRRWSAAFDRLLPAVFLPDGNAEFGARVVPEHLRPGLRIYDFGGGKNPYVTPEMKASLNLDLTGVDISAEELDRAPAGTYDRKIVADVARYRGEGDADLVICRALLEHVQDVEGAFQALASTLRPGGRVLAFVPSRNAVFARVNLLLPHRLKRRILFALFPDSARDQGFEAYYDRCTPRDFEALIHATGLRIEARHLYFSSGYFTFFLPFHVLWRMWMVLFRWVAPVQSAETFTYILVRPEGTSR